MMKRYSRASRDEQQAFLDYGDRVADGDTTPPTSDLESTYLRVQRAMRAQQPAPGAMPDSLRTRTWEDIMRNAATPAMRPEIGRPRTPAHRRSTPLVRMGWSGLANAALAVLVILAGFGAWQVIDIGMGGGWSGPAPSEGRYAQAPMTPVPAGTAETQPVVEPITACDLSDPVPIFTSVQYSEYKGTALYLWMDEPLQELSTGDLVLRCAGQDDTVLASDVYTAAPGPMAGIVSLHRYPDPASAPENSVTTHLDLVTGQSVSFGTSNGNMMLANGGADYITSEWVLGVSVEDPSVLQIANLETMETREISEFTDVVPSDRSEPWSVRSGDTMIVGFRYPYSVESTDGGAVVTGSALPGDMLVFSGGFDDSRWISIPDELPAIKEAWLSPNGDHLAVATYTGDSFMEEQRSYAIISTADGRLVSQSEESPRWDNASVSWVQDGNAIVFAEQHALKMLPAGGGASAETLLETQGDLYAPRTTYDTSTVVVQEAPVQDDADKPVAGAYVAHIVNTSTGETMSVEGRDVNGMIGWIPTANTLAMVIPDAADPETTTVNFYDAVTGEHIEDVDRVPYPYSTDASSSPLIGKAAIATTPDAAATMLTIGSKYMFLTTVEGEQVVVRQLPALPEPYHEYNSTVTVDIADNGSMASVIRSNDEARMRFVLDLTNLDAEWIEVPTEQGTPYAPFVSFVTAP